MGAWNDDYPQNTLAANQIHTHIQTTKQDIMERLRGYNDTGYEHLVFDTAATGRHLISVIGFIKIFSDVFAADAWVKSTHPGDGSMITNGSSLYLINGGELTLASTSDHGSLSNMDKADHPQYLDTLGERTVTGDWSLTGEDQLNVTTFGTGSTDAMSSAHSSLSWYTGHGVNSLWQRHFANSSATFDVMLYTTKVVALTNNISGSNPYLLLDPTVNRWESFVMSQGAFGGTLITQYISGKPSFSWSSQQAFYVASDTIINGASI